jgi:hypothetical protein
MSSPCFLAISPRRSPQRMHLPGSNNDVARPENAVIEFSVVLNLAVFHAVFGGPLAQAAGDALAAVAVQAAAGFSLGR